MPVIIDMVTVETLRSGSLAICCTSTLGTLLTPFKFGNSLGYIGYPDSFHRLFSQLVKRFSKI